jgi:hypothetical protein
MQFSAYLHLQIPVFAWIRFSGNLCLQKHDFQDSAAESAEEGAKPPKTRRRNCGIVGTRGRLATWKWVQTHGWLGLPDADLQHSPTLHL